MLKLQYFGHQMWRADSLKKTLMLGKIEDGRRKGRQRMKWLVASMTWWTWIWASSGSWWWTGRTDVLQSMRLQRVGHDWATEQQQPPSTAECSQSDISWTMPNELLLHLLSMDSLTPLRRSSGDFSPVVSVFLWRQHFAPSSMQQRFSRSWITGYYVKQRGKSVSRLIRWMPVMFPRWSRPRDVCWPAVALHTWPGWDGSHWLLGNTLY